MMFRLLLLALIDNSFGLSCLYVGTEIGLGISPDNGGTWTLKTKGGGVPGAWSIYVLQKTIYVGTFENGGLISSNDGGKSWKKYNVSSAFNQCSVSAVIATADGKIYASTNCVGGLYISTDNGESWTRKTIADGLGGDGIMSVVLLNKQLFVGTWGGGVSISNDGGLTWSVKTTEQGLPSNYVYSLFGTTGGKIYVVTDTGLALSTNNGEQWSRNEGLGNNEAYSVFVTAEGRILAGTGSGLYLSDDDGWTWKRVLEMPLAIAAEGASIYAGAQAGGLWISNDNGNTWQRYILDGSYVHSIFLSDKCN